MTTYVCNILCALYNIPTTHGKSIFFRAYMVFLCFHNHCNLALLWSEAQGSICEICPTNLASFLGFLGFFMDLLVQDSIWIYLFSLWPYGPIHSLWWWNLYSEGGTLHYTSLSLTVIVLHCWTKPQARRARPVRCAGWGCSLLEVVTTSNYSNIKGGSSSF